MGKKRNITTKDKNNMKCDCVDRLNLKGIRPPIFCSFAFDKPPRFLSFLSHRE